MAASVPLRGIAGGGSGACSWSSGAVGQGLNCLRIKRPPSAGLGGVTPWLTPRLIPSILQVLQAFLQPSAPLVGQNTAMDHDDLHTKGSGARPERLESGNRGARYPPG